MSTILENQKKRGPLLNHLDEIEAHCQKSEVSLEDIFNIFGAQGHYVLILFLILPFLQPIPLVGLSTPFGLLIGVVAVFAYLQKPPWLPQKLRQKQISSKNVLRIAEGSERIFEKISFLLYPRLKVFFVEPFRAISAFLILANAVLLALPLPIPFTNTFPAWMIAFHTLGQLEEDGLFILISYVQSLLCLGYFILLGLGVNQGLHYFMQ